MTTFVIPYFFSTIESPALSSTLQAAFPVLGNILSKAKAVTALNDSVYALACDGVNADKNASLSVAAVRLLAETGQVPSAWSCCASPVVITPNRDHLDLALTDGFDITPHEAASFCEELNDYFKEDDFHFSFSGSSGLEPSQWYCQTNTAFNVSVVSPFSVSGGDIAPHIPQGAQGVMWRKIFNDVQMVLHHSATNHKRSQLGKPEINSLWFWGGGELTCDAFSVNKKVFTDDAFVRGLALLGESKPQSLPNKVTSEKITAQDVFVANFETLDWLDWDERFFAPALQALKQNKINQITLHLDLKRQFVLKKTDLLKFWLSQKNVSDFI